MWLQMEQKCWALSYNRMLELFSFCRLFCIFLKIVTEQFLTCFLIYKENRLMYMYQMLICVFVVPPMIF
jgi:hypothetical protein